MGLIPAIENGGARLIGPASDGTNGQALTTDGSGSLSFTDVTTESPLTLTANDATETPLTLVAAASQTANVLTVEDSSSASLFHVTSGGDAVARKLIARLSGGVAGTDELQISHDGVESTIQSQNGSVVFDALDANQVPLVVRGAPSHAGDAFQVQRDDGVKLFNIDINKRLDRAFITGSSRFGRGPIFGIGTTEIFTFQFDGIVMDAGMKIEWRNDLSSALIRNKIEPASSTELDLHGHANSGPSIRLDSSSSSGDTRLLVYDADSASLQRVVNNGGFLALSGVSQAPVVEGTLTVRQPGGVAGTDELQISHDGTSGSVASQSGGLIISNAFGTSIETITTSTTLDDTHHTVLVDASSGAITVTLPAASGCSGRIYHVKKIDSSANTVTVDGNGAENVDGDATQEISTQYTTITVQSDGSQFYIV